MTVALAGCRLRYNTLLSEKPPALRARADIRNPEPDCLAERPGGGCRKPGFQPALRSQLPVRLRQS
ncbi:MAG: hypothetical protein KME26_23945 [Oscillatoria princeps RMCB-10]|nr:hypothetical protein [Oscillatoria princeps RMCB-10]